MARLISADTGQSIFAVFANGSVVERWEMALTRKQKRKLRWADQVDAMFNEKTTLGRELRQEVRRVEHRKREQFRRKGGA